MHIINIRWEGPLTLSTVIKEKNDWGKRPKYAGNDYGLYQIYGRHILCGGNTLLYLGKAVDQTFSARFKQHKKDWIGNTKVKIYLGRTVVAKTYSDIDKWKVWKKDVGIAEEIMIYKYTPNYNSSCIGDYPKLPPDTKVRLKHIGNKGSIRKIDNAPSDYVKDKIL